MGLRSILVHVVREGRARQNQPKTQGSFAADSGVSEAATTHGRGRQTTRGNIGLEAGIGDCPIRAVPNQDATPTPGRSRIADHLRFGNRQLGDHDSALVRKLGAENDEALGVLKF
jgi:hypothetical protein